MAKVAVLMAEGYEEGETLTIVDILRRVDIETATFYFGDDEFVNEAAWDAIGRDGSRFDRHQLHYLLSDHARSG